MKALRFVTAIFLACLVCTSAAARIQPSLADATATGYTMQSTSSYTPATYRGSTYLPGASSPAYVPSGTGDLDPFGASGSSPAKGIRKSPPGTGGDKDNPSMEGPMSDGTWFLLLLLACYAVWVTYRKKMQPTLRN